VFYALLLEPYVPRGTIPHNKDLIINTLQEFRDNVYKVKEILDRQQNVVGV
jgi:hypothetical protein